MQTQANITQSLRSHYYTQAAGPGASCVGALQYRCCLLTSKLRRRWERRQGKVSGLWVHVSKAVLPNQEETKRRFRFPWLCLLEWGFWMSSWIEPGVCDQFYKLPIEMSRPFVETTKQGTFLKAGKDGEDPFHLPQKDGMGQGRSLKQLPLGSIHTDTLKN